MEKNKIIDKIEEMYNLRDENGKQKNKAFFSHLMKSYLPNKSVKVALEKPKDKKVNVRCVFTKKRLTTVDKAVNNAPTEDFRRKINEFVGTFDNDKACFTSITPMKQIFGDKGVALQGNETKTYMSQESYLAFLQWVMKKYKTGGKEGKGDGHIKWIVNGMAKDGLHPLITVKARKPKSKKKPRMYSTGDNTATLGDLSALQKLKDKMKD